MKNSNSKRFLDSDFYESDVAYTGAPSHNGKRGLGTDKQPFLIVLSTEQENQYPRFVKMQEVTTDSSNIIKGYFEKICKNVQRKKIEYRLQNNIQYLKNKIEVNNEVIDYDNDNHRLYFLNKIISNLNSQFIDRFHGVTKRMLPLYYSEFEWRFNHRNCKSIMDKIKNYIMQSSIATRKMIRNSMDQYATARGLENA